MPQERKMELDELKHAWAETDLRLDGMEALLRAEYRDRRMDRARSILRRSLAGRAVELIVWVACTTVAASFWVEHRGTLHWLVIGLVLLGRVYLFDAPVLTLQRRLAQLRRFRVWSTLALGLPWWCLWLLVPLAALYQWTGVDGVAAGSGECLMNSALTWRY